MEQRALALDEEHLPAPLDTLDHEPLGGARDEVGDDRVDRDPPACDRHPRLARRHELAADAAAARLAVELERHGHLPDRAVGADGEDRRRGMSRFSPVGTFRPAGGLRRSRSSTSCSRASAVSS